MPLMFFLCASCDKDDIEPSAKVVFIADISYMESSSVEEAQEIEVTIQKPTPCHLVSKIEKTVSGNTFSYNIVVEGQENPCITVIAQEVVKITLDPSGTGHYVLKFLINGKIYEMRTVTVTE